MEEEKSKSIHEGDGDGDGDDLVDAGISEREKQIENEKKRIMGNHLRNQIEEDNEHQSNNLIFNIYKPDDKFSITNPNRAEHEKKELREIEKQKSIGYGNYEFTDSEHPQQPIIAECEKKSRSRKEGSKKGI